MSKIRNTLAKTVENDIENLQKQAKKLRQKGYYCELDAGNMLLIMKIKTILPP